MENEASIQPAEPSSHISGMTGGELWALRERLEAESASLLGHMLFGLSRIEVNLGLALVWVNDGRELEDLTKKIAVLNLNEKLARLEREVATKHPPGSRRRAAYDAWIARMHKVRAQRNQMVHGRWGVEPRQNVVVNIVGLPTGDQQVVEYTIAELAAVNEELKALDLELRGLRERWPV
ncbi:hypothetical protein [Variovorax sp. Sphag1AA]|uniref:hypothetical protein n=1 Tax=Variovorax sp. Sphag1AA TaxID=2587027 RepID=UPI001607ED7D|nr:hypothetical protein [Variovorax sp. Sphag1AA]MBB3182289.1 hypothetical protein [Variovorax sp. Sphag1AA]